MRRLIDFDPLTRTEVWHDYDESSDKTFVYEVQDIEPIINLNETIQNHAGGHGMGLNDYSRKGIKESWWHVAKIPTSVQLKWEKELGVKLSLFNRDDWTTKKIKQLLNSPEYRYLRTGLGRI